MVTGIAAGLFGALMMFVLRSVQHFAFDYDEGSFAYAVTTASPERRLAALMVGGAFVGVAWYVLRRLTRGQASDLDDVVWSGTGRLSFRRCLGTSVISEVAVGVGASLGREAAPKLMGGAAASALGQWRGLAPQQLRLLVACGGGAGFAAVYNVPIGGALLTAEILYGSFTLPVVLPALVCSCIATVTAWVYLPMEVTYPSIPSYPLTMSLVVFALVAGPLIGLVSVVYVRFIGWVSHHQIRGRWLLVAPLLAFTILGLVAFEFPQLLGNGKDLTLQAMLSVGDESLWLLAALVVLKPAVTGLCLGSGATGGLFTPTMGMGAVLGALLGHGWTLLWPSSPVGAFAVVAAAALLGAAMQAPLAALVLVLELTHSTTALVVPMATATALATLVARYLDGYSIYTSRLAGRPAPKPAPGSA